MLFDGLTCSESALQRVGTATKKVAASVLSLIQIIIVLK